MSKCEAKTASGDQCKHSAREGSVYCGIHQALAGLDAAPSAPKVSKQPQYKVLVMAVGIEDVPSVGILGASTVEEILQRYYENGYEVHTMRKYDRVSKLGDTPEHFWTIWLLKLK